MNNYPESNGYNFIYLLGELTTPNEIINEIGVNFPETDLNQISIIIFHTLVTFNKVKEIREALLNCGLNFKEVKSFLIPATEYLITRYVVRDFDTPNTIIRIRGGSWINAIAIADEVKQAKIVTGEKGYFKDFDCANIPADWNLRCVHCNELILKRKVEIFGKLFPNKCILVCNNPECANYKQETILYTDNDKYTQDFYLRNSKSIKYKEKSRTEFNEVPKTWNLRCLNCNEIIKKYKIVSRGDEKKASPLCSNEKCESFNNETDAYTTAPKGRIYSCFICQKELANCKVNIIEEQKKLQLIYYCRECKKDREFPIEYILF